MTSFGADREISLRVVAPQRHFGQADIGAEAIEVIRDHRPDEMPALPQLLECAIKESWLSHSASPVNAEHSVHFDIKNYLFFFIHILFSLKL